MSPIHSSRIYKDHFTILAFSAIYPFFSSPSSSIIIIMMTRINDILTCQLWSQLSQQPSLASATTALCHSHVTLFPLPRPLWADELESGDFLKWMKTKETHSSSGSDASGRAHVCCLSCSVTLHVPSFSETSPETAKVSPPGAHSWGPRRAQNMSKAIPETEVSGN